MPDHPINNPAQKEAAKAVLQIAATATGSPIAAAVALALNVGIEAFGHLSAKRTAELFDETSIPKIINKVQQSDDFASVVYSVWQKYNLESSRVRRSYLKKFLMAEVEKTENTYDNFSHIEYIIQNISLRALELLKVFHSGQVIRASRASRPYISRAELSSVLNDIGFKMHEQDVEYNMNILVHYNLVAISHGRTAGPFYNHSKLAFVVLEYINS
ncbi:hypothetical protein CYG49_04035 [Candidatus Saccharibacteria bacterium]|nr:MAG: hypothetical protein CYG49_04035 [Candidatus Saccharibacteria bacterium]